MTQCLNNSMLKDAWGMLRQGPVLAHEFGFSQEQVHRTIKDLNRLLRGTSKRIVGRWVHVPGRMGLTIRERLYELEQSA